MRVPCVFRKLMLLFQYWVRWMHGSSAPFFFKAGVIPSEIYTMWQILMSNIYSFCVRKFSKMNYLNLDTCHVSWIFRLIPAADTGFAKDAAFGYKSSNLREVCFCYLLQCHGFNNHITLVC